jgi:hypothetical protein
MELTPQLNNRAVRMAAALFFFLCVPLSVWESNYVHAKILVAQDPVATATNLLANEFIFRASIVSHIMGTVIFLIMVLLFYNVFRHVDKQLARFMIIPIIAQFTIVFIMEVVNFTALMMLKSEPRATLDVFSQQEVAYFLLRIHRLAFGADKIIFGLFFIPFGILVFRSGFAPRLIGILILIGGVGYVADTCLYILLQRTDYLTVQSIKLLSSASYSLGLLWFLIRGVQSPIMTNPKT